MKFSSILLIARPTEAKIELFKKQGFTDEQIEQIIAADPTEKDFCQWIASQVKKNTIRLPEDVEKIKGQLTTFNKIKKYLPEKDIARYTPETLYEIITEYKSSGSDGGKEKEIEVPWEKMTSSDKEKWKEKNLPIIREKILNGEPVEGVKMLASKEEESSAAVPNPEKKTDLDAYTAEWYKNKELPSTVDQIGTYKFQIIEVTDFKALMALSQGTNWCTQGEQYAKSYLETGPEYVFYIDGQPYAQWDPRSNAFLNVKDGRFEMEKVEARESRRGKATYHQHVKDARVTTALKLLQDSGVELSSSLQPFMVTKSDIEKATEKSKEKLQKSEDRFQKKKEKGLLSLRQKYEEDPRGTIQGIKNSPEAKEQLLKEGTIGDILFYCSKSGSLKRYSDTPEWTRWEEAEPRILAEGTIPQILSYKKAIFGSYTDWPEMIPACIANVERQTDGEKRIGALIELQDKVLVTDNGRAPYQPMVETMLQQAGLGARALSYYSDYNDKRSPELENFILTYNFGFSHQRYSLANDYYDGKSKTTYPKYNGGRPQTSKSRAFISPKRWPEYEQVLNKGLGEGDKHAVEAATTYMKQCSEKFDWPEFFETQVQAVVPEHEQMEKELKISSKEDEDNEGTTNYRVEHSPAKEKYQSSLIGLLTYCIQRDIDSPNLDKEVRWLYQFNKKFQAELVQANVEKKKKWDSEEHGSWSTFSPLKLGWENELLSLLKEYKALSWDRKVSSLRKKLHVAKLRQSLAVVNGRRVLANIHAKLRNGYSQ